MRSAARTTVARSGESGCGTLHYAPPPASVAEVACSEKETTATWWSAHAPEPAQLVVGASAALPPPSPQPPPHGESGSRHLVPPPTPAPAEPPSPFLHSQPSTPPLSKRAPGRRRRNRTISPHILHAGRAAVPTSVLKAEVVGGCGGRCGAGGEGSANRDGRRAASPASVGPAPS